MSALASLMPRDRGGRFLPKEAWTKKQKAEFERAKRYYQPEKNPIKSKKIYGPPIGYEEVFVPPQDAVTKRFLPKELWTSEDWAEYHRAKREGLFPGRFKKSKPKKKSQKRASKTTPKTTPKTTKAEAKALASEIEKLREVVEEGMMQPVSAECPMPEPSISDLYTLSDKIEDVRDILDEYSSGVSAAANPVEALAIINPDFALSQKIAKIVRFVKTHPIIFSAGLAVTLFALYMLYKTLRARLSLFARGADVVNGQMHFPGQPSYTFTQSDLLWLARSLWGEVSGSSTAWSTPVTRRAGAAVAWSYANNYMTVGNKRQRFPTFGRFIQAYSQAVSPAWSDPNSSKCQRSPRMCTPSLIERRRARRAKSWDSMPAALQEFVTSFAQGAIQNPVGTRTDFRMAGTGYRPSDAINIEGNVFGTDPDARKRENV
jgi:hypothetical protein